MKHPYLLATFIAAALLAGLPGAAAHAAASGPSTLAQRDSPCGPPPMKPTSCLTGTWVCRCTSGGQACAWDLVGCDIAPGMPRHPNDTPPPQDPRSQELKR